MYCKVYCILLGFRVVVSGVFLYVAPEELIHFLVLFHGCMPHMYTHSQKHSPDSVCSWPNLDQDDGEWIFLHLMLLVYTHTHIYI